MSYQYDSTLGSYNYNALISSLTDDSLKDISLSVPPYYVASFGDDYLLGELNTPGVKYYKTEFYRYDESETDYVSYSEYGLKLHTTVGTVSGTASRPLYVTNSSSSNFHTVNTNQYGVETTNYYRVMLFYVNSDGTLGYQTGRRFERSGSYAYRVDIPSDVTEVKIGVYNTENEYVLPTLSAGVITIPSGTYVYSTGSAVTVTGAQTVDVRTIDGTNISTVDVAGKLP